MHALGFEYCNRKKTYYVDGHERPDNVAYRKEYIKRYFKYERRCFRWIQLPMSEVEELEKEDEFFKRSQGYEYTQNGQTLYEFHVDDHPTFHDRCRHLIFGGHLSVRKRSGEKPIIMIGQDESIFKQYLLTTKQWYLRDGSCAPNPKEEGQGVMLSSFVSQDFGYGHDLSASQLAIINNFRRGKTYVDEEAAIFVHGSKEKKKLTESPFVRWLHYGQNNDGYWNYHHMIVQLEDIVDVLKALYGQSYDFLFFSTTHLAMITSALMD